MFPEWQLSPNRNTSTVAVACLAGREDTHSFHSLLYTDGTGGEGFWSKVYIFQWCFCRGALRRTTHGSWSRGHVQFLEYQRNLSPKAFLPHNHLRVECIKKAWGYECHNELCHMPQRLRFNLSSCSACALGRKTETRSCLVVS